MRIRILLSLMALGLIFISLSDCIKDVSGPLGIVGGSPYQPALNTDKEATELFIYRPSRFSAAMAAPLVYINHEEIVRLENDTCTSLAVEPGELTIRLRNNSRWIGREQEHTFLAEKGHRYYIRMLPINSTSLFFLRLMLAPMIWRDALPYDFELVFIDANDAAKEMKYCARFQPRE